MIVRAISFDANDEEEIEEPMEVSDLQSVLQISDCFRYTKNSSPEHLIEITPFISVFKPFNHCGEG